MRQLQNAALIRKWLEVRLGREIDCDLIGTGRRASLAHVIREAGLAGGAGGVVIGTIIRRCRDHNAIAVDVHIGRGHPSPLKTRCIYPPHLFPLASERDRSRCRRWCTRLRTVSPTGVGNVRSNVPTQTTISILVQTAV